MPDVVAICNSSEDTVALIRIMLEQEGFATVELHVDNLKRGKQDLVEFVRQHDPAVFVYDISPPYEQNWNFLKLVQNTEVMRGRGFVLTTTNKRALDELVGETGALEIVGKPYDIEEVVTAARKEIAKRR